MKHYTPNTPRAAIAIAAATITFATLVALIGLPTRMDTTSPTARVRGAIVVQLARSDFRVAGEMYARANALPADEVR